MMGIRMGKSLRQVKTPQIYRLLWAWSPSSGSIANYDKRLASGRGVSQYRRWQTCSALDNILYTVPHYSWVRPCNIGPLLETI